MDMSDLNPNAGVAGTPPPEPPVSDTVFDTSTLVAQLGGEVANALSSALERVNTLATTGRIERASLRALRDEVELARRVGIMGQQISRLRSGRVRLSSERLDLTAMLREALLQRGREIESRGIEVRQQLKQAEVHCDATLLFTLLQAAIDWSFEHAVGRIDYVIDMRSWPVHAQLHCAFAYRKADEVDSGTMPLDGAGDGSGPSIDTMSWRLVQQTASTLALPLTRRDGVARTDLCIEFPKTVGDQLDDSFDPTPGAEPDDAANAEGINSRPLAGSHVLVVASRREVRNLVREATRPMGLMIDFVTSIEEAREFCMGGMPHAVVHEGVLGGERFELLRQELLTSVPTLAFIQISEHGKAFEVTNVGGRQFASVGRDAIIESLPAALLFELARCG
jgi:hypothetical protein